MHKIFYPLLIAAICGTAFFLPVNFSTKNSAAKNKSAVHASAKDNDSPNEKRTEGLDALQWMNRTRAYPNTDIPAQGYARAIQQYNAHFSAQRNSVNIASGNWTSIGPTNIGGRTLSIALDPTDTNIVWLGSASGGLWKSTNGGLGTNAWTYINTGFPVLGVSTIAINPQNHNEMYIGTGEVYNLGNPTNGLTDRTTRGSMGMGILKSMDGGVTWTQSLNWTYNQERGIWKIIINPMRTNTVFAATTEGVYKSTDGGATWTQTLVAPLCTDMVLHATDTTVLMVGAGDLSSTNKGLYRSTDGGLTWNTATGIPTTGFQGRIQVALYPDNNDIAVAEVCDVYNTYSFYTSTDKGATWTPKATQDIVSWQGWYAKCLAFQPGNSNTILAGGVELFKSTNQAGGFSQVSNQNWSTGYLHSDIHDIIFNPLNANKIYLATDGGLFRSNDLGNSYTECSSGYVTTQAYIGSVSQTDANNIVTGLQDNYSISYFGSTFWIPVVGGDGCWNAIDPTDDQVQYANYQYLNVYQTVDAWNSTSFQILNMPSNANGGNPAAFLAPFVIAPSDNLRLYGGATGLYRSDNQGGTFNVVSPDPVDANGNYILSIGVSATNEDSLYIATAPDFGPMHLMLSTDGGATFSDRSAGLPDRYPRRITVDPHNSRIVYAVFSGFGTGHLFKSTDAGATWNDISTALPDVPFHCLMIDPLHTNVLYAGSDIGLFASTDNGQNWMAYNAGLPDWTMVFDMTPSNSDRGLLLFSFGHGVWKRSMDDILGISNATSTGFSFGIFPNPAQAAATISLGEIYGPVQVSIYNINGQLLFTQKENLSSANPNVQVDVSDFANGTYLCEVVSGNKKAVKKMMVQH